MNNDDKRDLHKTGLHNNTDGKPIHALMKWHQTNTYEIPIHRLVLVNRKSLQ